MLKKIYTCDCFLDISCCCLEVDHDFVEFERKSLQERKFKDIFVICGGTERRYSQFHPIKFVVCCKAFVDFQIDLFVKTETFPLKKISCNYKQPSVNEEFECDFDYVGFINCNSDDNYDHNIINCFESSICFSRKGYNFW